MNDYRINYGNGQVSRTFASAKEALLEKMVQLERDIRHREPHTSQVIEVYVAGSSDCPGDWLPWRSKDSKS